jgi:hypothetical protein
MAYEILADILVVLHFAFIVYVLLGGLLSLRWLRNIWFHLPCAAWGALIEFTGWICPLTPLEIRWRIMAGQQGYEDGFVSHYILPLVYPPGLTRSAQLWLGAGVILLNVAVYTVVILRWRRQRRRRDAHRQSPPQNT